MPNFTGKSGGGPFKMKTYGQGKNPIQMNSPLTQKPGGSAGEAIDHWEKYKSGLEAKKPIHQKIHHKVSTGFGNKADENLTKKINPKTTKKIVSKGKGKVVKKVAGKIASRAIPGLGWGLAVYDAAKFGRDWYRTGDIGKAWDKMWE